MSEIFVRGYPRKITPDEITDWKAEKPPVYHRRVLVFDTETTEKINQAFKIGYFEVYQEYAWVMRLVKRGLIYEPAMLNKEELNEILMYSTQNGIPLYARLKFIDMVFYREVHKNHALCIGFNLPFDITRLAYKQPGDARRFYKGGFTIHLSKNPFNPPIDIKQMGERKAFQFQNTKRPFRGYFADVQTLAKILLNIEHPSLATTCIALDTPHKKTEGIEHGRVNEEYIAYNINDVKATADAYFALIKILKGYEINIPVTELYSRASLGKQVLRNFNIKPFTECQPGFSPHTMGRIMTAYYGGRTECKIRKTPVPVTYLDFTSMYPTITTLMRLDRFITAGGITTKDVTDEIRELLSKITPDYLIHHPEIWPGFVVLVQIKPDNDILPVRMRYANKNAIPNIGVNYLKLDSKMWYSLLDIIASVLLSGKQPEIIKAIRFIPKDCQPGIKPASILGSVIDPKTENFVKFFVEERQRTKTEMKKIEKSNPLEYKKDPNWQQSDGKQQALKIIINAMSYGIFLELQPEDDKTPLRVYGLDNFITKEAKFEKPGGYFNPIIGVTITAGARLLLAIAEAKLKEWGTTHAYMDTDGIFVPPEYAQKLIYFVQPLSPYDIGIPLLKAEETDVTFYGISSKRYALYRFNRETKEIEIVSCMMHGLGMIINPFPDIAKNKWHEELWRDILKLHYNLISIEEIYTKYGRLKEIMKIAVSTTTILHRFDKYNEGKTELDTIKPFGFCNYFPQSKNGIHKNHSKLIAPYSNEPQSTTEFIDYNKGGKDITQHGQPELKPLLETFLNYINHPERKFEGKNGILSRKHIVADKITLIGKEINSNNTDKEAITGLPHPQKFINQAEIIKKILKITPKQSKKIIARPVLWKIQNRAKTGALNLNTPAVKRLLRTIGN